MRPLFRTTRRLRPSEYLFANHQRLLYTSAWIPRCQPKTSIAHGQRRQIFDAVFNRRNWDDIRFSPWKRRLFVSIVLVGGTTFLGVMWMQYFTVIRPFNNFPDAVAKELRLAIAFERFHRDPQKAAKHYQKAVYATGPAGMDPYSDECIGIRLRIIAFLENYRQYGQAVEELKALRRDCVKWVLDNGDEHISDGRRTKVLEWAIKASIHLGELFTNPGARDAEQAEEALVWAVETLLKEKSRRDLEGQRPGEGDWISGEQFGATLESLAHHYDEKRLYELSAPLFLQAVTLCPADTCHAATLMNNLASALAQQRPQDANDSARTSEAAQREYIAALRAKDSQIKIGRTSSGRTRSGMTTTTTQQNVFQSDFPDNQTQASQWAEMALSVAASVPTANRDEECTQARCAALYNLGEIAERRKDLDEARRRYGEAQKAAAEAGWQEGVSVAKSALARLGNV